MPPGEITPRDARQSLTWRVTEALGKAIVSGAYPSGAVLPNEDDIAAEHGVGRSAVREAAKILEAKGLIAGRPRLGTAVLDRGHWNQYDRDVQAWTRAAAPDRALLLELLEMRSAFEPLAAMLAASRGSVQAVRAIRLAYGRMAEAERGRDDPHQSDLAFHTAILGAAGNRFLAGLAPLLSTALMFSIRVTNARRGDVVGDLAAHARVLDAIERRDPEGAASAMRSLLADVGAVIAAFDPEHEGTTHE